jgi:hypothetical protein
MEQAEYLVEFGLTGDFGRFRASSALYLRRGSQVVIRSERGLELGQVLRPVSERVVRLLPSTAVGELLRRAGPDDESQSERMARQSALLLERGNARAAELGFPLTVLDVEALLDGAHAILHVVRWGECDVRELVSGLSVEFGLSIRLEERGAPAEQHGCGSCGSGGCGSCGSGGGCSSGCGVAKPEEVSAYFAELRQQMERRMSLL